MTQALVIIIRDAVVLAPVPFCAAASPSNSFLPFNSTLCLTPRCMTLQTRTAWALRARTHDIGESCSLLVIHNISTYSSPLGAAWYFRARYSLLAAHCLARITAKELVNYRSQRMHRTSRLERVVASECTKTRCAVSDEA